MTISCPAPGGQIGVALRLSEFLNCQARALGENGFQALAGGPLVGGLLSGLVTIFVALIGYRFILGTVPTMRDGIGWAVRLGMVLTLATGWPAFQTLVYRVAIDAPGELATILLPVTGLPVEGLDGRVQQAYDAIRLGAAGQPLIVQPSVTTPGSNGQAAGSGQIPQPTMQTPSYGPFRQPGHPQTASWFAITTSGVTGALRLAAGFLLAIGPIPIMALLFEATLGLFVGWLRALAGAALATLAGVIVTALDLVMVESELAHLQAIERGMTVIDPQALTTIVLAFTLVMLAAVWAATRVAGGLRLSFVQNALSRDAGVSVATVMQTALPVISSHREPRSAPAALSGASRTQSIADALTGAVHREQLVTDATGASVTLDRRTVMGSNTRDTAPVAAVGLGAIGRRSSARRARSAARRDRTS